MVSLLTSQSDCQIVSLVIHYICCDYSVYIYSPLLYINICVVITVFIYSMPGYKCSIKERMLYSSCKSPLISKIESLGIEITKKVGHSLIQTVNALFDIIVKRQLCMLFQNGVMFECVFQVIKLKSNQCKHSKEKRKTVNTCYKGLTRDRK